MRKPSTGASEAVRQCPGLPSPARSGLESVLREMSFQKSGILLQQVVA